MSPHPSRPRSQARSVLAWAVGLFLVVTSFGWVGSAPAAVPLVPVEAALTDDERAVVDSVRAAFAATLAEREAAFAGVDSLGAWETRRLRRSLNRAHVRAARQLGVAPVETDSALAFATGLGRLDPASPYYATRRNVGRLAPVAVAGLDAIGERFHQRLAEADLPPVRFVVSSTFRTAEHQDRLRGVNANAARGRSSHEYGTTFDIAYRRYRPIAQGGALNRVPDALAIPTQLWLASELEAQERAWSERVVAQYAGLYEAELGRALAELEDQGVLLALREVSQPCFHVTVARRLG